MRITNSLLYSSSMQGTQSSMKHLYDINQQMSSKMKIQNSYEDSSIYVNTMRLDSELVTLEQVKEASSKAQTFSQNTDSTLNEFTTALDSFKTKLIQASNTSNSSTSLGALANELQALRDHMVSLGNTSINGQFLFSGSSLLQKPLQDDGTYNGNGDSLTALVGSGVELPYNLDGKSLFLGTDGDYNRTVSTNVAMYNQTKLHPEVMTTTSLKTAASEVYLKESDTIRDMVGDTNSDSTDDPKAVFYLSGRKSDGVTFSNVIEINSSSKVSDLLENIGSAYGNTTTNKVVSATLNARGQIEVKDLKSGSQLLEMNIFGAVDRSASAGTTGDAKQTMNIDNLTISPNVDIIAFNKSNFSTTASSADLTMRTMPTSIAGELKISFPLSGDSNISIETATSLTDIFPSDVDHLNINGTRFPLTGSISGQTVNDLMTAIGGGATLSNNTIITTNSTSIVPMNASNALAHGEALPDAINYVRRGFEKDGNELTSNISQVSKITNQFVTATTKLVDVAGVSSLAGKQLVFNFTDINGKAQTGILNLSNTDTTFSIDLNSDGSTTADPLDPLYNPNETFSIYNGARDTKNTLTKADEMTYQQLMDVISMATSGNLPKKGVSTHIQTAITESTDGTPDPVAIAAATTSAKAGVSTETAKYIQKAIDFGIAKVIADAVPDAVASAAAQASYEESITNANLEEYNHYLSTAKDNVEVSLDYQGKLNIVDTKTSTSKIEFNIYDKSATDFTGISSVALSFMANDSVMIENPTIDFFKDLDAAIQAVRTGNYRMDSTSSDPRNIGIQNSLTKIDHILDHVTKEQTKIGAYSNSLTNASDRAEYLSLNVQTVRSSVIDVDVAEAYLEFNTVSISYQAMLSTISKINSMSLLNYM
ncbi:MAG: flagellin [Sulfurospirillaceae bacterium]|nr:flagellin [Sulfurospirillaceae bacterium]